MLPTTWVEVSRAGLEANLRAVRDFAGVPVCAVVKANAYGHGIVETARILSGAGAAMLACTRVEEAQAIRDGGVDAPLLLLTPPPDFALAARLDCALPVASQDDIDRLPPQARVHLKVDTGMGRLGLPPEEAVGAARRIAEHARLEAVWTHFADAAGSSGRDQLARFLEVREALRISGISCAFHAANSAATIAMPEARLSYVRVGTLLYGQHPPGAIAPFPLRDTFSWLARVVAIRTLRKGAPVGYGSEWTAPSEMRIAAIPVGYADGFTMEPAARTPTLRQAVRRGASTAAVALGRRPGPAVWFGDRRAPVVGRVAMQAITVSLDGLDDVEQGAVARIPARRLSVSPLIPREYV